MGKEIPWLGEWIMHTAQIPVRDYALLADRFNPREFDADEWVDMAEKAGMRYIVFTSKHHDGFSMFHSHVSRFNVVDATPFKRDVVAELTEACRGTNVRLGLYYSQAQDWYEPHAGNGPSDVGYGNTWDFPTGTPEGFERYLEHKVRPQITELLTQYGPIALLWFDNPIPSFTRQHACELRQLVKSLQPDCLISARIGHGLGDIRGFGDNELPEKDVPGLAEACVTMNDTWGYKKRGGRWRSGKELWALRQRAASRDCNFLLNVGPMADGRFPPEAVDRLKFFARHQRRRGVHRFLPWRR